MVCVSSTWFNVVRTRGLKLSCSGEEEGELFRDETPQNKTIKISQTFTDELRLSIAKVNSKVNCSDEKQLLVVEITICKNAESLRGYDWARTSPPCPQKRLKRTVSLGG
jgi:hypothetical protein